MKNTDFRKTIDEIKSQVDLVQTVRKYVELDRHNKGLCPFHPDTKPSFSVHPAGQYFYCFGCGQGGDVITFLMFRENKTFFEIIKELAEQTGIQLPKMESKDIRKFGEARTIDDILLSTALHCHLNLPDEVRSYLTEKRGLTNESIERFQIGYAGGGLRKHLIDEMHYDPEQCIKAGVLKRGEDSKMRDFFYKRIIFPNFKHGRVVHMSGRSLDDKGPKYLHLPGKIEYLYNEDALSSGEVIITEGIIDCISAEQAGYPAVATLGTNNFKSEYKSKFAHCGTVYLCFDGDAAGREATVKVGLMLDDPPRVIELPIGYDINDYFRDHTDEDFKILFDKAEDFIEYQVNKVPRDGKRIELRSKLDPMSTVV